MGSRLRVCVSTQHTLGIKHASTAPNHKTRHNTIPHLSTPHCTQGTLQPHQLRFLVTGALSMDNPHSNPADSWLSSSGWNDLCDLDGLDPAFSGIIESVKVWTYPHLRFCRCACMYASTRSG